MGGGHRIRGDLTRLGTASLCAAMVLLILGSAAAAARGGRAPAAPPPPTPGLVRATDPEPLPSPTPPPAPTPRPEQKPVRHQVKATPPTTVPLPPVPTADLPPPPTIPPAPTALEGKGMWVWKPEKSDQGNVNTIVARAMAVGLSHIYVRTGSSWDGFDGGAFLEKLLPLAHAHGIKVYAWDFPKLEDVGADVTRAMDAINFTAHGFHHVDGFAADIETPSEGTQLSLQAVQIYGSVLRGRAGPSKLLIAAVPRPSQQTLARFPYADVVAHFDVIAPMIYWLNREPGVDVADAMRYLQRFGKPIAPIGQAYDGEPEGGRPGVPPRAELLRFMEVAGQYHAAAVSFWDWQEANGEAWDAIRDGPSFLRNILKLASH